MTKLILVHPNDKLDLTKTIIDVDNWRVIGRIKGGKFYLVTSDCRIYHINQLTIKKFNALLRMGLEMTRQGKFDTVALVCPKCGGSGVTDWITDVVGVKIPRGPFEPTFKRDPNVPVYKTKLNHNGEQFTVYFSRALIGKEQQHCTECKGTGLFLINVAQYVMKQEVTEYNFNRR